MFLDGIILPDNIETPSDLSSALEAAAIIDHKMKEEYILRDKYFPYIESFIPKTENILFRHIAAYEDKHSDILNTPYILKTLPFGQNEQGEDYDIIYKCTNIDVNELRADMKKVPLPGKLTKEKAAFLPFQVTAFFIIRYYMLTKQVEKAKIVCGYYGYSIYWKRFHASFKRFPPVKSVMTYTINKMTYRNKLKSLGSLKALLNYIVWHVFTHNAPRLVDCCDEDVRYVLDQVQSDIGSKVNNIAQQYYADYNEKREMLTGKTLLDNEGTQRIDTSITATVEKYAHRYTNKFFSESIDLKRVKMATTMATEISYKELCNTMEYIHANVDSNQVYEFYSAIFLYYLTLDDDRVNEDSIRSLKFVAKMRDVITKGNSSDKNIITIISYATKWLEKGSNTFRLTSRDGTKANYRRGVYNYFLLSVTN